MSERSANPDLNGFRAAKERLLAELDQLRTQLSAAESALAQKQARNGALEKYISQAKRAMDEMSAVYREACEAAGMKPDEDYFSLPQLVVALKAQLAEAQSIASKYEDRYFYVVAERNEAIAELDALRQQTEALRKERDGLQDAYDCATQSNLLYQKRVTELEAALRYAEEAMAENDAYQRSIDDADKRAREFEAQGDMYGWNFWKGVRSGIINRSITQQAAVRTARAALASPAPQQHGP